MALHVVVSVNDHQIGSLHVRRRAPRNRQPLPDDMCLYDWTVTLRGRTTSNVASHPVVHRYGDDAWSLISRVLQAAGYDPATVDIGGTED